MYSTVEAGWASFSYPDHKKSKASPTRPITPAQSNSETNFDSIAALAVVTNAESFGVIRCSLTGSRRGSLATVVSPTIGNVLIFISRPERFASITSGERRVLDETGCRAPQRARYPPAKRRRYASNAFAVSAATSPRTFPRKTQYDHPVYVRMIGSRNSVPISMNACDRGAAAASHRVMLGATMYGNRLIASP